MGLFGRTLFLANFFLTLALGPLSTACVDRGVPDAGLFDAGPFDVPQSRPPELVVVEGNTETSEDFQDEGRLFSGAQRWRMPQQEASSSWRFRIPIAQADESAFLMLHSDDEASFIVERIESPSGGVWISNDESPFTEEQRVAARGFPAQLFSSARALPSLFGVAQLLPAWGTTSIEVGNWLVDVKSYDVNEETFARVERPTDLQGEVWRRSSTNESDVFVSLHLYFVGELSGAASTDVAPLDVNNALSHDQFTQSLRVLQNIFSAAGVELLEPELHEIDDLSLQVIDLDPQSCSGDDLDRLFLSVDPSSNVEGLHFFFVDRFSCLRDNVDVGAGIAGLASGVPALMKAGVVKSGVAVANEAFLERPALLGRIMAHEAGHAFGLFHTVESEALFGEAVFDIIDDTPNGPGAEQNLMYYRITSDNTLSEQQGNVLKSHPVVGKGL